jgi:hypothetical protein
MPPSTPPVNDDASVSKSQILWPLGAFLPQFPIPGLSDKLLP